MRRLYGTRTERRRARGFTLLEVMIALAILVVGIVGLLGRVASNVETTQEMTRRGIAVDLARGKMYDIEEMLARDGFQELEEDEDGDFGDEGYPNIEWEAVIEKVEMPGLGAMQAADEGLDAVQSGGALEDSPIGGLLGGLGGGGGGDPISGFLQGFSEIITSGLEASIRKVTLTVSWPSGRETEKLVVVCYFTNPSGLDQMGLPGGAGGLPGIGGGSGGSGSGSGGSGGSSAGQGSGGSPRGVPGRLRGGRTE